ncbi:hypothetical protein BER2_0619 [plant metagenome]|uniref:Uncharacterized protein n=1 Tax=plant metagenome TaxID=1297885 RepID=A0A484SSN0_9ZZZZ
MKQHAGWTLVFGMSLAFTAQAQDVRTPTEKEAATAVAEMLPDYADYLNGVKLGTCIPAVAASQPGQVACTAAIRLGAAVNETQLDFVPRGQAWDAMPSSSQDKLPFPDPKLH